MGSIAISNALGKGLMAAGEGVDKHFQYKMEQQRLNSLKELETQKLGIMRDEQKSNDQYRQGMVRNADNTAFMAAQENFQSQMEKRMQAITRDLPANQARAIFGQFVKGLDMEQLQLANEDEIAEAAAKLQTFAQAYGGMEPDTAEDIIRKVKRLAVAGARDWNQMVKRFPDMATEMTPHDVINTMPELYDFMAETAPEPVAEPEAAPTDTSLMGAVTDNGPTVDPNLPRQRIGKEVGLFSSEGYGQASRAMFTPVFDAWDNWIKNPVKGAAGAVRNFAVGDPVAQEAERIRQQRLGNVNGPLMDNNPQPQGGGGW